MARKQGPICKASIKTAQKTLKWYTDSKRAENLCAATSGGKGCDLSEQKEVTKDTRHSFVQSLAHVDRVCGRDTVAWLRALAKERIRKSK